jgi:hypothetical protein
VRGFKHISRICGEKLSKNQVSRAITLQNRRTGKSSP